MQSTPQVQGEDSPLCSRCRSLQLDGVVGLQLAKEQLSDTIWDWHRPYTWHIDWWEETKLNRRTCQLCRILFAANSEWGVVPRIGAHSAQTLFKTVEVPDTTLLEVYAHSTTLLVPDSPDQRFTARNIDHRTIDYALLRQWTEDCIRDHANMCAGGDSSHQLAGLKVIDCNSREIIAVPDCRSYVALSYLWGEPPASELTQLQQDGVLGMGIPQVVEDAIVVAKELGIPYLWVDKYCIDQTDAAEKHHVIRNMDRIYNSATVTIVAAAGNDANFGLPGVSRARDEQVSITFDGRRFLVFPDSTEEIRRSRWSTRAWTYQEGLLSRRRLVFTMSQVYFQCMEAYHWEGLRMPPEASQRIGFYRVFPEDGIGRHRQDIVRRLNEYASRQLTFESDSLNAILGIFKPYQLKQVYHLWGIPFATEADLKILEINFITALGWCTRLPEIAKRRQQFPSWSWVGWACLDNLTIPWAPESLSSFLLKEMPEMPKLSVSVFGRHQERISVLEYVLRISSGVDFTQFSQSIVIAGPASQCQVRSPWDVSVSMPRPFTSTEGVVSVVRMMAIAEKDYARRLPTTLNVLYIGCQANSSLIFTFLILREAPGNPGSYTRDGTLTVTTPWPKRHRLGTAPGYRAATSNDTPNANHTDQGTRRYGLVPAESWLPDVAKFFDEEWEVKEFMLL